MIKFEDTVTPSPEQWRAVIMGARNPMNSWGRYDSDMCLYSTNNTAHCCECVYSDTCQGNDEDLYKKYIIGPNDYDLLMRLCKAGTDHRKFMRMLPVYVTITAPLYWWKEFSTYKVGTVANSCSTMHKIHDKEFVLEDFSCEHLIESVEEGGCIVAWYDVEDPDVDNRVLPFTRVNTPLDVLKLTIDALNENREKFLETKDKKYWWQMIQLLPSSYNQKRTVMLNFETLTNMYHARKNHKLTEWRDFCSWIEQLPYSELITK